MGVNCLDTCDDGVTIVPHGNYETVEEKFFETILKSPEWGVVAGYGPGTWSDLELPIKQPEEILLDVLSVNSYQFTNEPTFFNTASPALITHNSTPNHELIRTAIITESDISDCKIVDFGHESPVSPEIERIPCFLTETQDTADGEESNWEYLILDCVGRGRW